LRKPYRPGEIFDCMARHLGVRYIYGGRHQEVEEDPALTLRHSDLMSLSAVLRDELEDAIISLDRERIALLVRKVSDQNPSLGNMLKSLTDMVAYTPIFHALESCKTTFTEGIAR